MTWPQAPVHMTLQPDGNVLMWPAECQCIPNAELDGGQNARTWNPTTNVFTQVPNSSQVFCAGHTPMSDGRTMVVGGHIALFQGIPDATIFNGMTWSRTTDMSYPRWYPSAVRLSDGRILAVSGNTTSQTSFADTPEVYDPMTSAWTQLTGATLRVPAYSFLFVLPGGTVFNAGPSRTTRRLNVATPGAWTTLGGDSLITGNSAVIYGPGRVMKSGAFGDVDNPTPTNNRTVVIDTTAATPLWRETGPMAFPRAYHNLTLLPDGTVLVTGGSTTGTGQDTAAAVNAAELWNPTTETWRTLASNQRPRIYHSTALLLPDGRVVSAGGEFAPYIEENAEFFSPPYLFLGSRPTVSSVPPSITYGTAFTVQTPNTDITRVSLLAPASVTHGFDMNQRYLSLPFTPIAGGVSVTAPSGPDLAPPGYYLLFLVNSAGVPSVGRFVPLGGTASSTTTTLVPVSTTSTTAPGPTTTSTSVTTTSSTTVTTIPGAPVAAWGFDEGQGNTTADATGNGSTGTLSGAAWAPPGQFGNALTFNGTSAYVSVADRASLDITAELTLEAWVNPTATNGYRTIIDKTTAGTPCNYYLAIQNGLLEFGFYNGTWRAHSASVGPALNTWTHVAATYSDAANSVRLYLNGTEVLSASQTTSLLTNADQLRIGIGFANEAFSGRIDEVRVYNRVLTAAEIVADRDRAVGGSGTTSTSSTSSTTSTSSTSSSSRSTTSTSRTTTSSTSTSTSTSSTSSTTSTSNTSTSSTSSTTSTSSTSTSSTSSTTSTSSTSTSSTSSTSPVPSTTSTSRTTTSSTSTSSTSTSSTSTSSTSSSTTTTSTSPPVPTSSTTSTTATSTTSSTSNVPAGLVAAYGFSEGSQTTTADASGNANTGTLNGATWTTQGQFGNAVTFNGMNAYVTVADRASLDLTGELTLEAWINPTAVDGYRTIIDKTTNGQPSNYYLAIANGLVNFGFFNSGWREHTASVGAALNTWTHVAATYSDAANQVRLYVNGTEVLTATQTNSLVTNAETLRIGIGFSNEAFSGSIDEVRVYNRALTAAEIQADRLRAVP